MDLPKEATDRRARSLAILASESVPYMSQLPVIETAAEVKPRAKEEIAYRALSLLTVALKGEGLEQDLVAGIVRKHGLASHLTPNESVFISNPNPSERDSIQFAWRYECAWVLLWALGYVEELDRPDQLCDVASAVGAMAERTTSEFLSDANQRSIDEILDAADLIYRYHWAVVSARMKGQPPPAELDGGVVQERHYALNWLIRYVDQEWDDISTDT
jgi:hypothetical protein